MRNTKKLISMLFVACFLWSLAVGCGPAVIVRQPPPPRIEVRPAKHWASAVWIDGHWKWSSGRYIWVSGHWEKPRSGKKWEAGHWNKTPRGYVWVKGHWR